MVHSAAYLSYLKHPFATCAPRTITRTGTRKAAVLRASFTSMESSALLTVPSKSNSWDWKFNDQSVKIYYEEHGTTSFPFKKILMLPTISSVSSVEEWRTVAKDIVQQPGTVNWHVTIVDWPGLGSSDTPKLDYNVDVMEKFLADFINASNDPQSQSEHGLVIVGGGHAATIVIRAAKKGLFRPTAIAAVAPTWAGPFPILFGRNSSMEFVYGLFRGTLRSPAIGWMVYKILVSNAVRIDSQYKSHVYADASNVTPDVVARKYNLTTKAGARYAPAAFLTGLMDPVKSREELLELIAALKDVVVPVLVVSSQGSPSRSKAEMKALQGAKGVDNFVEVPGALLPHEEYPAAVAKELYKFLVHYC